MKSTCLYTRQAIRMGRMHNEEVAGEEMKYLGSTIQSNRQCLEALLIISDLMELQAHMFSQEKYCVLLTISKTQLYQTYHTEKGSGKAKVFNVWTGDSNTDKKTGSKGNRGWQSGGC